MDKITFDNMPKVIAEINSKIDRLLAQIEQPETESPDRLMTPDELSKYLPETPARATIYCWVNQRLIPYEKHGNRLYFRVGDVKSWLNRGRQMSTR